MKSGMQIIKPILEKRNIKGLGTVILSIVRGDLYDIRKNLVGMMLEGGGFEVVDLGVDVPPEKFVEATKENKAEVIALSALLTTTIMAMKEVIETIRKSEVNDAKIMIRGAPVTQSYADEIEADGYAPDAALAVDKAKELLELGKYTKKNNGENNDSKRKMACCSQPSKT